MVPPNGLPISRAPSGAERHTARNHILKCARSRSATRVGCMGLLGGLLPSIAPESHAPTTPPHNHTPHEEPAICTTFPTQPHPAQPASIRTTHRTRSD